MQNVKVSQKKGVARLLEIAGEKRYVLFISGIFSVFNALLMLVPYLASFFILEELLINYGHFEDVNKALILKWGLFTISSIALAMICAYGGFVLSHFAAYRILYNIRLNLSRHIGALSLGFLNKNSIGSIKKTLQDNVEKSNFL